MDYMQGYVPEHLANDSNDYVPILCGAYLASVLGDEDLKPMVAALSSYDSILIELYLKNWYDPDAESVQQGIELTKTTDLPLLSCRERGDLQVVRRCIPSRRATSTFAVSRSVFQSPSGSLPHGLSAAYYQALKVVRGLV